jgi:mRNA interferase MazF
MKGGSFDVPIPATAKVTGVVLSNQLRSVDWLRRNAEFLSVAPRDVVFEVLARIEAVLGLNFDP